MSKPTTPADIVEAIKYIIHGCARSRPDVTVPAASQPIVGKYICDQFITPLREEIAQLNIDKQNMASQLAYLSHVRLEDWSRNNPVQTNPPPAVPPRIVKFEIDGVQWYPYTSSSAMPGMSYYTAFPVYLLVRDKTTQTRQQLKYPDGLTMHSNLTEDIIGYRFINESDDPFYNTPINYSVYYNTTEPHMFTARWFDDMDNKATTNIAAATNPVCYRIVEYTPATKPTMTPSDKDRIALAKWYVGNDTGISSKAMAAVYLAGTDVFDKGTDNTPRDAPDLGRCVRLVALCPDIIKVAFPILRTMHPVWAAYVDNWNDLVLIHSIGDHHKTTELMDKLREAAMNKPDPLQHIKDAYNAGRLISVKQRDNSWLACPVFHFDMIPEIRKLSSINNRLRNPANYRVLLNHTDIKPTTVFRNKGTTIGYVTISEVTEAGVYFTNTMQLVTWNRLADTAEYSHDGVTWKPCLVPQPK